MQKISKLSFLFIVLPFNTTAMHNYVSNSASFSHKQHNTIEQETKKDEELKTDTDDIDETKPLLSKKIEACKPLTKIDQINQFILKYLNKHLLPDLSQIVFDYSNYNNMNTKYTCCQTFKSDSSILPLHNGSLIVPSLNGLMYNCLELNNGLYTPHSSHPSSSKNEACCFYLTRYCCSQVPNKIYCAINLKNGYYAYSLIDGTIRIKYIKNKKHYTFQILNENLHSTQNKCLNLLSCFTTRTICNCTNRHLKPAYNLIQLQDNAIAHCTLGEHTIKIWRLKDNKYHLYQTINTNHTDRIFSLMELQDGSLASISIDSTIKIWKLKDNQYSHFQTLTHEDQSITNLIQLKNGSLASCSDTIKIWKLKNGQYCCTHIINTPTHLICHMIQLKDGSLISSSEQEIKVWRLQDGQYSCIQTFIDYIDCIGGIIQLQDGSLASYSSSIKIWKLQDGQYVCVQTLEEHLNDIKKLIQLKDGSLISYSIDDETKIWHNELSKIQIPENSTL